MQAKSEFNEGQPFILLEPPPRLDAPAFFSKWLPAAVEMQDLWIKARAERTFSRSIERLVWFEPNFALAAIELVAQLKIASFERYEAIVVPALEERGEEVTVMILAGLFKKVDRRYQFCLPATTLSLGAVKAAALQFASTEDADFTLHSESVVEVQVPAAEQAMAGRLMH